MREARQLLQRFIKMYRENSKISTLMDLVKDVDDYLAKPLPEPVTWHIHATNVLTTDKKRIDGLKNITPLYAEPPALTNEERSRLETLERICEGLTQDHIDGGFTIAGLSGYAKGLEEEIKRLKEDPSKPLTDDEIISDLPDEVTTDALAEIYILGFRAAESHHSIREQ